MYIVEVTHEGNMFLNKSVTLTEAESLEKALELYEKLSASYSMFKVKVLKAEEIKIPYSVKERVSRKVEEKEKMDKYMLHNNLTSCEIFYLKEDAVHSCVYSRE